MEARTQRRLVLLSSLLVLFLAIFAFKDAIFTKLSPHPSAIPEQALKQVNQLHIIDSVHRTDLYKKNNTWYTKQKNEEYPADQNRIGDLLVNIGKIKKTDVYSTNKKNHKNFGIGTQRIVLSAPGTEKTIYIGSGYSPTEQYIRFDEENEIYAAAGFDTAFTPNDYRDLSLHIIKNPASVTKIMLEQPNQSIEIEKRGSKWYSDGTELKGEKIDYFMDTIQSLNASDMSSRANAAEPMSLTLSVTESTVQTRAVFAQKNDEDYAVTVSGRRQSYTVKAALVESLKKTKSDFIPD